MKKFIIVIICLYLITYIRGLRNDNESLMMDNQVIEMQNIILQKQIDSLNRHIKNFKPVEVKPHPTEVKKQKEYKKPKPIKLIKPVEVVIINDTIN